VGCHDLWVKNAGTTYQRAMNLIFHYLLGIILKIPIDDVIVKSDSMDNHLADLHLTLERMRRSQQQQPSLLVPSKLG
jgi:hypothetical protein